MSTSGPDDKQHALPDDESAGSAPRELLGDLETIRALLDEPSAGEPEDGHETRGEDNRLEDPEPGPIPLLDDMIDGAWELDESDSLLDPRPALGRGSREPAEREASTLLNDDLFDALLGEGWKKSAGTILSEARGAIEAHRTTWTPEDTDALNRALKERLDETLNQWLRETVRERLHELHDALLKVAETVLDEQMRAHAARNAHTEDD